MIERRITTKLIYKNERFQISRLVAKNGTGGIYEAFDALEDRKVLLHRFFSEKGDTSVRGWEHLFKDISRQWKLIKHPGFMKLHEAGIDNDGAFMSMHFFNSNPLLTRYPASMPMDEFYNFINQACRTIDVLHEMGVVHGALSPNSFLVSMETVTSNQYIMADLGLTQLVPKINRRYAMDFLPSDPAILAPELFERLEPVFVTDIYMLGHIFYYMLAGAHPLADLPLDVVEDKHFAHDFPRLDELRPHIPEAIATWIQSMMLPHPDDRLQDMREVIAQMPPYEIFSNVRHAIAW
jgi:serine/threonine protein kinase